ncbi:MAG: bacteriohemerythrin [Treponemataceae bacterium]|nr:bacteriohemerythrin [Treponemataceae bacterium]
MLIKYSTTPDSKDKDFITWDPKFKIGIPTIDTQHENLVKLCNEFYQSLLKNNDKENNQLVVKQTLEKCLNYAATHFKEEERLMIASHFSGYKQHKASHDAFTEKCEIAYMRIEKLTTSECIKFAHFLREWIQTHIAHEDRLYLPTLLEFLKKNQSKQ